MKKIILSLIFILNSAFSCEAFNIDLRDWTLMSEFVTPLILDATSEDLGRVVYQNYQRISPHGTLEIILTEGKGSGWLYVPEYVDNSKKLMPASEYKILEIDGHKAIFERQPHLPPALSVYVDESRVLNIESPALKQEELISIAREILSSWKNTK